MERASHNRTLTRNYFWSVVVGFINSVRASQDIINDEVSHFAAELLSTGEVGAEMHSSEDSAERSLIRSGREALKKAFYAWHNLGGDLKVEAMTPEKGIQNSARGSADHGVRSRIGWVWRGFPNLWKPVLVGHRRGVVVRIGSPNGSHRPPEVICIFGIVEGNYAIRQRQVKQREKARILRSCQVVSFSCRLADLIPVVLNGPIPKPASQRLVRRSGIAVYDPQRFHFIENVAVHFAS